MAHHVWQKCHERGPFVPGAGYLETPKSLTQGLYLKLWRDPFYDLRYIP